MDKPLLTKPTSHLVGEFGLRWLGREYSNTDHLNINFAVLQLGWAWQKICSNTLPATHYTKQVWQLKILSAHLLNPILPFFLLICPFIRTQQLDIYIWHSNHNLRKINVLSAFMEAGVRLYICSGSNKVRVGKIKCKHQGCYYEFL